MINHFIKVFTRTSARDGLYTAINITGLAIGLAATIFIGIWAFDEWTYDAHHADRDRIFQVMGNHSFPEGIQTFEDTPAPMGPALAELPMVELVCRVVDPFQNQLFKVGSVSFYEQGFFADKSITSLLTFHWLEGGSQPLANRDIMISERMARKYFGQEKALGKEMVLQNNKPVTVTGVFQDAPSNSTFVFDYLLPYEMYSSVDIYRDEWGAWSGGTVLIKLRNASDKQELTALIHEKFTKPHIWVRWGTNVEMFLHGMKDWRLRGTFTNGIQSGRIDQVKGVAVVAVFILLMASANFVNLATARVSRRAKEVGVRKVIGARRSGLVLQFMTESFAITFLAVVAAMIIVITLTPYFETLTSKQVDWVQLGGWSLAGLVILMVATAIVAGIYPSIFLSSIQTVKVLKGGNPALTGASLRRGLIVFQFALSIIFIIGSLAVFQQLDYMRKKDLGFDRENVFFFRFREAFAPSYEKFKADALTNASIESVIRSSQNPMQMFGGMVLAADGWPGKTSADEIMFYTLDAEPEFLPTLGFDVVEGRLFSDTPADTSAYVINETAMRAMKLSDPLGVVIKAPKPGVIIGVIKDFNGTPLREKHIPMILSTAFREYGVILIKYQPGQLAEALSSVEASYRKFAPDFPIELGFMDDTFAEQYSDEILMGKLANICTSIAVAISCLGLFGLISFSVERRKKEIGVRKVLGADLPSIVKLLSGDTVLLILIATFLGVPLSAWLTSRFLDRFAFHTGLNYWWVALLVLMMFLLALITISVQSIRAARANPAETLRTE